MTITVTYADAFLKDNGDDPDFYGLILDESLGLQQNPFDPTGADEDDGDDVVYTALPDEIELLISTLDDTSEFGNTNDAINPLMDFASDGRVARSPTNAVTVTSTGVLGDITLAGEFTPGPDTAMGLLDWDSTVNPATFDWTNPNLTDSGLNTLDDNSIFLFRDITYDDSGSTGSYTDDAGIMAGDIIYGIEEVTGDLVLILYMVETTISPNETGLTFYAVTFEPIKDGDNSNIDTLIDLTNHVAIEVEETVGFDFDGAPPGKSLFLLGVQEGSLTGSTTDDNDLRGLLVHSQLPVVQVNTSNVESTTIGWGNQGINDGDVVVFTFVRGDLDPNYIIPNLSQTEADLAANIEFDAFDPSQSGQFDIAQTVGSATQSLFLRAYFVDPSVPDGIGFFQGNLNDGVNGTGFMDNRSQIDFTQIKVELVGGTEAILNITGSTPLDTVIGTGTRISYLVDADGTVEIRNLLEGDTVLYEAVSLINQIEVEGESGNFDIGGFQTSTPGSQTFEIGSNFLIEDAGIGVQVTASGTTLSMDPLDETTDPDDPDDREAPGEDATPNDDDVGGFLAVQNSDNTVAALFDEDVGTLQDDGFTWLIDTDGYDPADNTDTITLVLINDSGSEAVEVTTLSTTLKVSDGATNLGNTAGDEDVVLVLSNGKVYGMYNGDTTPPNSAPYDNVAFIIEIDTDGTLKATLIEPILHDGTTVDGTGETPQAHDNTAMLGSDDGYLGANRDLTVFDGDNDSAQDDLTINIMNLIKFQDDGPTSSVTKLSGSEIDNFAVSLDETDGVFGVADDRYGDGDPAVPSAPEPDGGDDEETLDDIGGGTPIGAKETDVSGGLATLFTVVTTTGNDDGGDPSYKFSFVLNESGGDGVKTNIVTTANDAEVYLFLQDIDGDGENELVGREGSGGGGPIAFLVDITGSTSATDAQLLFQQMLAFKHDDGSAADVYDEIATILTDDSNESVGLNLEVTQTDSEGDEAVSDDTRTLINSQNSLFSVDDDGPELTQGSVGDLPGELDDIALNLDETTGADAAVGDLYNGSETESPPTASPNGNADDPTTVQQTPVYESLLTIQGGGIAFIGSLSTAVDGGADGRSDIDDLFGAVTASYGRDGMGAFPVSNDDLEYAYSLVLSGTEPVATNLVATKQGDLGTVDATGRAISLIEDGGIIYGMTGLGTDGTTADDFVAFSIEVLEASNPANVRLEVKQYITIEHGSSTVYDEVLALQLTGDDELSVQRDVKIIDGDDDVAEITDSVVIVDDNGGFLSFDDTGIELEVNNNGDDPKMLEVDETVGDDRFAEGETPNGNLDGDTPGLGRVTGTQEIGDLFGEDVTTDTEVTTWPKTMTATSWCSSIHRGRRKIQPKPCWRPRSKCQTGRRTLGRTQLTTIFCSSSPVAWSTACTIRKLISLLGHRPPSPLPSR